MMRAFVYPHDSYIGLNVSSTLSELGYELLSLAEPADYNAKSQFLQIADVVILELYGNEEFVKSAAVEMSQAQARGREQVLIGISDALVWATCPLKPAESSDEASSTLRVTDSDWNNRSPCVSGLACHEAETAVVRAARKGRLRTHVVCPGLPYGNGESGDVFHPLFKTSWEASKEVPPKVFGAGSNRPPLVHVSDLAKYVASVASYAPSPTSGTTTLTSSALLATAGSSASVQPPPPPYLLVADEMQATQLEVVQSVSTSLGTGDVSLVNTDDLLFETGVDRYTLDITFVTTPLPGALVRFSPSYPDGFLRHLPSLIQEYKKNRNLSPLRIILTGPPMSGKTHLATRLAKQYGLSLIGAKEILAAVSSADPDLQKAVQAELSSKEPRVTPKNMAALLQSLLSSVQMRNRGYILDAFPSLMTPAAAKFAFSKVVPMTPEELALKEAADAAAANSKDAKGGKAAPPPAAKGKDAKGKGPSGPEGPDIPPDHKLVPDPFFAPSHVIDLSSEDSELLARLKLVEVAEMEAAKLAAAAAGAPSKDAKGKGKDSGPVSTTR